MYCQKCRLGRKLHVLIIFGVFFFFDRYRRWLRLCFKRRTIAYGRFWSESYRLSLHFLSLSCWLPFVNFYSGKVSRACKDMWWPGSQFYSYLHSQLVPVSVLCCSSAHLDSRRLEMCHSKALLSLLADQFLLCVVHLLSNLRCFSFTNTNSAFFPSFLSPSISTWIEWKWQHHLQMKGKCGVKWQVKVTWHKRGRLSYDSAFSCGTLSVIIEKANDVFFFLLIFSFFWQMRLLFVLCRNTARKLNAIYSLRQYKVALMWTICVCVIERWLNIPCCSIIMLSLSKGKVWVTGFRWSAYVPFAGLLLFFLLV